MCASMWPASSLVVMGLDSVEHSNVPHHFLLFPCPLHLVHLLLLLLLLFHDLVLWSLSEEAQLREGMDQKDLLPAHGAKQMSLD